jgi:hypothetical protein
MKRVEISEKDFRKIKDNLWKSDEIQVIDESKFGGDKEFSVENNLTQKIIAFKSEKDAYKNAIEQSSIPKGSKVLYLYQLGFEKEAYELSPKNGTFESFKKLMDKVIEVSNKFKYAGGGEITKSEYEKALEDYDKFGEFLEDAIEDENESDIKKYKKLMSDSENIIHRYERKEEYAKGGGIESDETKKIKSDIEKLEKVAKSTNSMISDQVKENAKAKIKELKAKLDEREQHISELTKEPTLTIYRDKKQKIKIGDLVKVEFIPTKIGVVVGIDKSKYRIKTKFRDDTGLNFKVHIVDKSDINVLPYSFIPSHISEAYSHVFDSQESENKDSKIEFLSSKGDKNFNKEKDIQFAKYKGNEIMFEPRSKEYHVDDIMFNTLEEAKKHIDENFKESKAEQKDVFELERKYFDVKISKGKEYPVSIWEDQFGTEYITGQKYSQNERTVKTENTILSGFNKLTESEKQLLKSKQKSESKSITKDMSLYISEFPKGLTEGVEEFIKEHNLTEDEVLKMLTGYKRGQISSTTMNDALSKTLSEVKKAKDVKKILDFVKSNKAFAYKKPSSYKLGDQWSTDFDYKGLLEYSLKVDESTPVKTLEKLHSSFEDNNYHTLGSPLWDAISDIKQGNEERAKMFLLKFKKGIEEELTDEFGWKKPKSIKVEEGIKAKFKVGDHVYVNYGEERGANGVIQRVYSYEDYKKSMKPTDIPYYEIKGIGKEISESNLEPFKEKEIVGYAIVDPISGRIVASKKNIKDLIELSPKLEKTKGFEDIGDLFYEIIKKDDKNVIGDKVTSVDINLMPIEKPYSKEKDIFYAKEFFIDGIGTKYVKNNSFDEKSFKAFFSGKGGTESRIKLFARELGIKDISKYIDGEIIENIDFANDASERAVYLFSLISEEPKTKGRKPKSTERILGVEYTVGTKAHAKAVADKKHLDDLSKSESSKEPAKKVSHKEVLAKVKAKKSKATPSNAPSKGHKRNEASDRKREALPLGKRISESGNVYYENRLNRADQDKGNKFKTGGQIMKKGKEISFENSNLYLVGKGNDTNGNAVVKVKYPNSGTFSIQTLGNLPKTKSILGGVSNLGEIEKTDLEKMEKEIVSYIESFGSASQKRGLKTYFKNGGEVEHNEFKTKRGCW